MYGETFNALIGTHYTGNVTPTDSFLRALTIGLNIHVMEEHWDEFDVYESLVDSECFRENQSADHSLPDTINMAFVCSILYGVRVTIYNLELGGVLSGEEDVDGNLFTFRFLLLDDFYYFIYDFTPLDPLILEFDSSDNSYSSRSVIEE